MLKSKIFDAKSEESPIMEMRFESEEITELDGSRSSFHYANFVHTLWDNCSINNCNFKEAFMSEVKFKKIKLNKVDLTRVDFFKTSLKGIALSDSTIDGIMVSDTHAELRGAEVNVIQAVALAQILGVKIV